MIVCAPKEQCPGYFVCSVGLTVNSFPSVESSSNENFSQQGQWIIQGNWNTVCAKTNCFKSFKALSTTNKTSFSIHCIELLGRNLKYLKISGHKTKLSASLHRTLFLYVVEILNITCFCTDCSF